MDSAKRDLVDERIIRGPKVCGGQAVFKGTRVTPRTVLASLADGDSAEEILADFPKGADQTVDPVATETLMLECTFEEAPTHWGNEIGGR